MGYGTLHAYLIYVIAHQAASGPWGEMEEDLAAEMEQQDHIVESPKPATKRRNAAAKATAKAKAGGKPRAGAKRLPKPVASPKSATPPVRRKVAKQGQEAE